MMNLVVLSYGREAEYKRAILTILSFYAQVSLPVQATKVVLFTDQPQYFRNYFDGLPLSYVLLTANKIQQMKGSINFLHRMKIALIEEAFGLTEGVLLYADSDTFFTADPVPAIQKVCSTRSLMHESEFHYRKLADAETGSTDKKFWDHIVAHTFRLPDGGSIKVTPEHMSWNAGVMALHPDHAQLLDKVYALTDRFYPITQHHASEQFAFSIVLQEHTAIDACETFVYHYWYRIKKEIIDLFLNKQLSEQWANRPFAEKMKMVKNWCSMLPAFLQKHPLAIQDDAIQAFNKNKYHAALTYTGKALLKKPLDIRFVKDVLYHLKRRVLK